jgi:hypothetical protein
MNGEIFSTCAIYEKDLGRLLESFSFPLTKAEIIHNAEACQGSQYLLDLLRKLPSRFYHSEIELVSQCVVRSLKYR